MHTSPATVPAGGPVGLTSTPSSTNAVTWARANSHLVWLGAILITALAIRVLWISNVQPDPRDGRFDDSVWYYGTGHHLAKGDGYIYPFEIFCRQRTDNACDGLWSAGDPLKPTALWAPGYPLVLAGLFHLPGDDVAAARAANVLAGVALIAGTYYLASKLWSKTAGLFAAATMAFFPSHIYFSSLLLTESLFAAAAVLLLCLAVAWTLDKDAPRWRFLALGLAAGCVGMLRPEGAFIILAIIGTWAAVHRSLRRVALYTGLLLIGMAVLYVPWTVRNAIQLDAPVVGTTGMGQVLIQGHNPDADGQPDVFAVTRLWEKYEGVPFPEREIRINNGGISESIDYAVHHLPRELELMPQRLSAFFQGDDGVVFWLQNAPPNEAPVFSAESADRLELIANIYYYVVAGVMVLGLPLWVLRSRRTHTIVWGPFAIYVTMWALFFVGDSRYHLPLLPVFAILAGIGLAAAVEHAAALLRGARPAAAGAVSNA